MCKVCGCATGEARIDDTPITRAEAPAQPQCAHHSATAGAIDFGTGPAGASVGGMEQGRLVEIEQEILSKNTGFAERNRHLLAACETAALNLISSPGAGKTTLLVETIRRLLPRTWVGVVEGDQETSHDADRIRAAGADAVQVNTGRGCHLDAHMVGHALERLELRPGGLLFIENVGNLVCPAGFDLGETARVVILSVTEGEDKPIKYPDAFATADLMILSKSDLLPHLDFDVARCTDYARRVNPKLDVLTLSAKTGAGMDAWLDWIGHAGRRGLAREANHA